MNAFSKGYNVFMCVLLVSLQVTRSGEKEKIYFQDSFQTKIEPNTPYTDRISVNRTGAEEVVLTIDKVQLEDEREFICQIKSFTEVSTGSTNLRVFRKSFIIRPFFHSGCQFALFHYVLYSDFYFCCMQKDQTFPPSRGGQMVLQLTKTSCQR